MLMWTRLYTELEALTRLKRVTNELVVQLFSCHVFLVVVLSF